MKYYYKIFLNEDIEESLKYIKASDIFIKELKKNSQFIYILEEKMVNEIYVGYDVERIQKGKSAWTWSVHKQIYSVNWNFKGEVHPHRKNKVNQLKKLWDNENHEIS